MVFIYRQEILKDVSLFTSQPKAKFYDELFVNLDLSRIPAHNSKIGRAGYSNYSMICAFIVMKCEGFSQISDLHDYLSINPIIIHYFGFDISRELPSSAKFTRFIREFDNDMLQQVLKADGLSLIDSSFTALDATPVKANVSNNNPKSFKSVKPDRQCIKTADFQKTVVRVRNTAVRLSVLKAVDALAIANVGITARKTAVAQNTQLFPMITGFPLTEAQ